ncbi:MAG: GNAT family N-acetyltransferase [Lachnospiraceae bacterium]|nr:GNAT family N-acetyltransferase [Lachnospiraceae bacterium]
MASLRVLGRHENDRTRPLYEAVFPEDGPKFTDYYYESRGAVNRIYVMEEDSAIVSMLHLNPVMTSCYGTLRTIPYIVAVATDPAFRHQGMMRTLLQRALNDCAENRVPFTFLMPASEEIYRPFGFRNAWPWKWEADCVGGASGNTDAADTGAVYEERAGECTDEELALLSGYVNRKLAEKFDIFVFRTPEYYRDLAREHEASGDRLTVRFEDGRPVCAVSSVKEDFPPMMARITDLVTFIRMIRPARGREMLLKVTDDIISSNNGIFRISLRREGSVCERLGALPEGTAEDAPVSCDISALPALLGEDDPFGSAMICEEV